MHPCDKELVAMYITGDLCDAEAAPVEAHLNECPACRALAHELQADARRLREAVTTMQMPETKVRHSSTRRWLPAAAAAVLAVLLIGVAAGPAIADTVRNVLRWMTVRELSAAEWLQYKENVRIEVEPAEPASESNDPRKAEAAAGFPILTPTYLPEGWSRTWISVSPVHPMTGERMVVQKYRYKKDGKFATFNLTQTPASAFWGTVTVPEGHSETVKIGEGEGILVRGKMELLGDSLTFVSQGPISLHAERRGQGFTIQAADYDLSVEELIKIAESIPE